MLKAAVIPFHALKQAWNPVQANLNRTVLSTFVSGSVGFSVKFVVQMSIFKLRKTEIGTPVRLS